MPWLSESIDQVLTGVATTIAGAAAAIFALRRRYSSDSNEITKDKAESRFVVTLLAERDAAVASNKALMDQRVEDARMIAKMEAQVLAEQERTKEMREEILTLRLTVQKLCAIVAKLDPSAAARLEMGPSHDSTSTPLPERESHDQQN